MEAKTMITRFSIKKPKNDDFYIYLIPRCDMFRLHKGDAIRLHKYARGHPSNEREVWVAVVTEEPVLDVGWSDPYDRSRDAYDPDSVIPTQWVTVEITSHKYV